MPALALNAASVIEVVKMEKDGDVATATVDESQPSAIAQAGCCSWWTFHWVNGLISLGRERPLVLNDIPSLQDTGKSEYVLSLFEVAWAAECARSSAPSLRRAITTAFGWRWLISFTFASVFMCCLIASPTIVKQLLTWLENPTDNELEGYGWAVLLWICFFTVSTCVSQMYVWNTLMGVDMRSAIMMVIFHKASKLSAASQVSAGMSSVNLMSVDVERLWQAVMISNMAITMPLLVGICLVFMCLEVGVGAICGTAFMALMVPIQGRLAGHMGTTRREMSAHTDARVGHLTEAPN